MRIEEDFGTICVFVESFTCNKYHAKAAETDLAGYMTSLH